MKSHSGFWVIPGIFICFVFFNISTVWAANHLIFAVDIVRHGDRNPVTEIPKSPHHWDGELSALTQSGADREFRLGKALREEYVGNSSFLSQHYDPATLYVRSTETNRTIQSAKALLGGLYPAEFRNGLEIPIEVVKRDKDDLLLVKPSSNIFSVIKMFFWKKMFWRHLTANLEDDLRKWSEATGLEINNLDTLDALADNLLIRKYFKVPLPSGIDSVSAERILALGEAATISFFEHKEISKPTGLRLLSAIKQYFANSIAAKSQLKYVLYFAHDGTIMSVLSTLGTKVIYPGFAARLHFGLYQVENKYEFRVTLQDQLILIPACGGSVCSMSQLTSLLSE